MFDPRTVGRQDEWSGRAILIYSYFLVSDKLGFVLKMIGLRPDQSFCIETAQFQSKAAIGLPDGISKKAAIESAK